MSFISMIELRMTFVRDNIYHCLLGDNLFRTNNDIDHMLINSFCS